MANFDWIKPSAHNEPQKHRFHREARKRLQVLAEELFLTRHSYGVRSNKGGVAVSGEITLHGEMTVLDSEGQPLIAFTPVPGHQTPDPPKPTPASGASHA